MATYKILSETNGEAIVEVSFAEKKFTQKIVAGLSEEQLQAYADEYETGHAEALEREESEKALLPSVEEPQVPAEEEVAPSDQSSGE